MIVFKKINQFFKFLFVGNGTESSGVKKGFLSIMSIVKRHTQKTTSVEYQLYPAHEERDRSKLYVSNRHQIINEDLQPCFFCGKTLVEVKEIGYNLETHHWFEYSLWNALDPKKVKADLEKLDFYGYATKMKDQPVSTPDDIRNLVSMCSPCHRETGYGIHHATIPFVWARRALKDKNLDVLERKKPLKPTKK